MYYLLPAVPSFLVSPLTHFNVAAALVPRFPAVPSALGETTKRAAAAAAKVVCVLSDH